MKLKFTPQVTPRYWGAIMLASMCGANLGDFFPDILEVSTDYEIIALAALLLAIMAIDRLLPKGIEALYWMAILVVRAAATAIADFTVTNTHVSYVTVGVALAGLLTLLLFARRAFRPRATDLATADGPFWLTMLVAGSLGTVLGDGIGHAFASVRIGVPVSAVLASLALALILGVRAWTQRQFGTTYWIAIVAVRWWGTNTGDIFAFLATLKVSIVATGAAMAIVLHFWQSRGAGHGDTILVMEGP